MKGWRMVLQKLWVSQNFSRILRVSQSRFFSSYVRLTVSFLIRRCLESRFFARLRVFKSLSVCLVFKMTSSRHLVVNYIKATFNFREKVNTKLSEFHKKLEKSPQPQLAPEKKVV